MKKNELREDGYFHDIREWIFTNVIDDSMMNIPDYVATCVVKGNHAPSGVLTPPQVAAMFDEAADRSEKHAKAAAAKIEKGSKEWQCMELDLQASAALGRYYGEKIRAATELMALSRQRRRIAKVGRRGEPGESPRSLEASCRDHHIPLCDP